MKYLNLFKTQTDYLDRLSSLPKINVNLISDTKEVFYSSPEGGGEIPTGIIGYYDTIGLTNDSLSVTSVWKDKSDSGNDLQFKNFAWKLNSGVGIYAYDFTSWNYNIGGLTSVERTSNKIQIKAPSNASTGNIHDKVRDIGYNYDFRIRVTGIKSGNKVSIRKGASSILMNIEQDGIYHVNTVVEEDWDQKILYIFANSNEGPDINLTIEQIPDYEGAICFDGVDDYAICNTFPILTKEKGYTVMALRKWINKKNAYDGLISNKNAWDNGCAFVIEYSDGIKDGTVSFGRNTYVDYSQNFLVYQTSQNYNGNQILTGDDTEGTDVLNLGRLASSGFSQYSNFAIYALCIIDHDTSDAERELIINKWKHDYPELFFDQAWTVTGKTNDDEDRATVKNLTGNGNDLVLSNFAFAEDSGYGDYPINMPADLSVDQPFGTLHFTTSTNYNYTVRFAEPGSITIRFKISGLTEGSNKGLYIRSNIPGIGSVDTKGYETNGIHEYHYENETAFSVIFYNGAGNEVNFSDFYIEIIPDYEGYLVTDGVDDSIKSSNFNLYDNFTFIGEWKLLQEEVGKNAGIIKGNKLYIYNTMLGISININSITVSNRLNGIKSLKAICSDGRCYDENWNEIVVNVEEHGRENNFLLLGISSNDNVFAKIAFKNCAFYSDSLLTKDQCIKAYDYLQTFKAK